MKVVNNLLLLFMICSLWSCQNDLDSLEPGNRRWMNSERKHVVKTFNMSFGGDYIAESEEPLLRASESQVKTFVGINVYWTDTENLQAGETKYAYGLFDSTQKLSINLITGYLYRFEATVLIEDNDKLFLNEDTYGEPFNISNGDSYFEKKLMGSFIYTHDAATSAKFHLTKMKSGTAYVDAGTSLPTRYGHVRFPRVKRFYGSLGNFDPKQSSTVDLPMEYKSFGLKLYLENIPENTTVTVSDATDHKKETGYAANPATDAEYFLRFPSELKLSAESNTSRVYEAVYSLNDLTKNSQQFKLRFQWNKGHGNTEVFYQTFTVEAKKKKVLNISVTGEIDETKSGNINFLNLDSTLTEEEVESVTNKGSVVASE